MKEARNKKTKNMAYSDFTLPLLQQRFGLNHQRQRLFTDITPLQASEKLLDALKTAEELPIKSEKAKSELIVMPILLELRSLNHKKYTIYSGENLNADSEQGLNGECDFILTYDTGSFELNPPILQVVEAKKNDVESGIAQCAAQLLGARIYNERQAINSSVLYGCVTTGDDWLFIKLEQRLLIDIRKLYLGNLAELLGTFQFALEEQSTLLQITN
jgi:hypothetical protein